MRRVASLRDEHGDLRFPRRELVLLRNRLAFRFERRFTLVRDDLHERVRIGLGEHDRVTHRHRKHGREHDQMHVVHGEVLHEHRAEQRTA